MSESRFEKWSRLVLSIASDYAGTPKLTGWEWDEEELRDLHEQGLTPRAAVQFLLEEEATDED